MSSEHVFYMILFFKYTTINMVSKQVMKSFCHFVLNQYGAELKLKKNTVEVWKHNECQGQFFLHETSNKVQVYNGTNDFLKELEEIVRFRLSLRRTKPIHMNENQCKEASCFEKLKNAYIDHWNTFNGVNTVGHMQVINDLKNFISGCPMSVDDNTALDQTAARKLIDFNDNYTNSSQILKIFQDLNKKLKQVVEKHSLKK